MANEIYDSSWWGNPKKDGWGDIYFKIAFPLRDSFIDRVVTDGGIVESDECIIL